MTDVITTQRLVLRRFRRGDAAELVDLLNNLEVVRWLTRVPYPYRLDHALDFIENVATRDLNACAILKDQKLVGTISVGEELGYWIGQPYWNRGYVTEAARAMVARYFESQDADLPSGYHLGNERSCAVLTNLGFRPTGRRCALSEPLQRDVIIQNMVLTRACWEAAQ
ncbi:GNAT family N-acetyltransferase [Ruegeria sp. 2012CJ41-6]|uniref:GNAT family N-acetyltransferase n=1 Tax=Ruegeria spongiae TaxID=2942209 RepID=A0ABT0PYX4_9RHOB|nr:GNAT family N-acetyltransferase [Ruegeria spongiae]MCL6282118.1 GNAT family N-acetyltransferase [Ruegeria spongiae]